MKTRTKQRLLGGHSQTELSLWTSATSEGRRPSSFKAHGSQQNVEMCWGVWFAVSVAKRAIVVRAVPLHVNPPDTLAQLTSFACCSLLLFLTVKLTDDFPPSNDVKRTVVRRRRCLVEQSVQGLLVNASFGELHLRQATCSMNNKSQSSVEQSAPQH